MADANSVVVSPRRLSLSKSSTRENNSNNNNKSSSRSSNNVFSQQSDPNRNQWRSNGGATKPSEVYGFVGSITTVVATVLFIAWAYTPEVWLQSVGITYYPSRYWAIALPAYAMVTVILGLVFYVGMNFLMTPPPTSVNTIFDEYTREPVVPVNCCDGEEQPIEPISDIPICHINALMFGNE